MTSMASALPGLSNALASGMEGYLWALKSDRPLVAELARNGMLANNFWLIRRGFGNMQASAELELLAKFIAMTSAPGPYSEVKYKQSDMAASLGPVLKAQFEGVTRVKALICSLRVLNALQSHVTAGSNEVPKLTDLGLPAEAITDPFTGTPLHVKKTPQGWLVYSVGPNLQDDGGKIDDPTNGDVGVGPPPPVAMREKKD
jgi:hypothetical protein